MNDIDFLTCEFCETNPRQTTNLSGHRLCRVCAISELKWEIEGRDEAQRPAFTAKLVELQRREVSEQVETFAKMSRVERGNASIILNGSIIGSVRKCGSGWLVFQGEAKLGSVDTKAGAITRVANHIARHTIPSV